MPESIPVRQLFHQRRNREINADFFQTFATSQQIIGLSQLKSEVVGAGNGTRKPRAADGENIKVESFSTMIYL